MRNLKQEYIEAWIRTNRPDLIPQMDALLNNDAFILTMGIAFEAGRQFQADEPNVPLDDPSVYLVN